MKEEQSVVKVDEIKNKIFTFRGLQVMLDFDLAILYNTETRILKQAVKRNLERFPEDFMFVLTRQELNNLTSQFVMSNLGGRRHLPYAFTEQGVAMLSAILKNKRAIDVNITIMRAFVAMRKIIRSNVQIFSRLESIEKNHLSYKLETDHKFEQIFNALQENNKEVRQGIFFNGQLYDSYSFVIKLIKKAQKEIIIIDNYVDNTLLDMLTKKNIEVDVLIITLPDTKLNSNDIQKFNKQYPKLHLQYSSIFHDRFVIIDKKYLYHIGASSLLDEEQLLNKLLTNF